MQTYKETSDSMFVMDFKYNRNSKLSPTVHENNRIIIIILENTTNYTFFSRSCWDLVLFENLKIRRQQIIIQAMTG